MTRSRAPARSSALLSEGTASVSVDGAEIASLDAADVFGEGPPSLATAPHGDGDNDLSGAAFRGCAQNMMLSAWGDGVTSCPNGLRDPEAAAQICGAAVKLVLTFGYPTRPRQPESRPAKEWSARAKRKPVEELVRRV